MSDAPSQNPDHNRPKDPDGPAGGAAKLKLELYGWHKQHGTLGVFYELYPEARPVERGPGDRGGRER